MIEICPLTGIGEIEQHAALDEVLADSIDALGLAPFHDGDILVVTQKIVSKAEDRFIDLAHVVPGPEALRLADITRKDPQLVELVLMESRAVLRAVPNVLITQHRSGHVMANAGIDRSNIGSRTGDYALLLPDDADRSAERIRQGLQQRFGHAPAVVISDSFGRPWRMGVVCVALGASGLPSLQDKRGEVDRDGRVLEVTQIALADMVATAAGLAMGEGSEGVPAALVRGLHWTEEDRPASVIVRPITEDLFQ